MTRWRPMGWSVLFLFALLAASFLSGTMAATADWTQLSPAASPPPRSAQAMAYDPDHGKLVVFGGYDATHYLSETWTFDGARWTLESPRTSPPARAAGTMVFDAVSHEIVLFGGYNG